MKQVLSIALSFFFTLVVLAKQPTSTELALLKNRFRIDGSVKQAVFIIHRDRAKQAVTLIKPNGEKIFHDNYPDNVFWQRLEDKDIITVLNPSPGPWQAIGKISSKNKIQILTDLHMNVDIFPERLYQGESVKFTARVLQNGKLVEEKDYLDNLNLVVNFTKYIDDTDNIPQPLRPQPLTVATFFDDGNNLDEYPRDGVFTVELPIEVTPGKYRVNISSNNGVFLRSFEQIVLVYPSPVAMLFKQNFSDKKELNQLEVKLDPLSVVIKNSAIHAEFSSPSGIVTWYEKQLEKTDNQTTFYLDIDHFDEYGRYFWNAVLYTKDALSERPLIFKFIDQSFEIANFAAIEKARTERRAKKEQQRRLASAKEQAELQKKQQLNMLMMILASNLVLILAAFGIWFKKKKSAQAANEAQSDDN